MFVDPTARWAAGDLHRGSCSVGMRVVPEVAGTMWTSTADGAVHYTVNTRAFPTVWLEVEKDPEEGHTASVVAMRVGFALAPSVVRLTRQVLSMSLKSGERKIVLDVTANDRAFDDTCDNAVAHVGMTRTTDLAALAFTRDSVLTPSMLTPCKDLDDLPGWAAARQDCELEHVTLPAVGAAQHPVYNDGDNDVFNARYFPPADV